MVPKRIVEDRTAKILFPFAKVADLLSHEQWFQEPSQSAEVIPAGPDERQMKDVPF